MLVILASPRHEIAPVLASRWAAHDAALLTGRDLSLAGWNLFPARPYASTAVIGQRVVEGRAVDGVLTRLSAIAPSDLDDIVAADQGYVAAEMTAFLLAWLSDLDCPILNPPTASCLGGPGWRPEHWVHLAGQLGMRVREMRLGPGLERRIDDTDFSAASRGGAGSAESLVSVTVVGDRCFGDVDDTLADQARCLAAAAGVPLIEVCFSGADADAELVSASAWPDIGPPAIGDAILEWLVEHRRC